jgi:signal transduction histidine kinase/CheY-like chemotaxis protein
MSFRFHPTASAQQLADIIPHGLAILNQKYEVVSENINFQTLIPRSQAKFIDCWMQSIHPDDVNRVNACFNEASSSKVGLRVEYRTRNQDTWCVLTLNCLEKGRAFGLDGYDGFIVTVADITPEKKAEMSQRQLAKDAEEHKQHQERFIDMISHEIRNPLSAILHCTEDILEAIREKEDDEVLSSRIIESAETICLCISHQKRILDDVLTFSKIDASMLLLSPQRVQPKTYFAGPISLFRPQLQRNDIQFDYQADFSYADHGIEWVMADLDRMGQVLINLLSNAIKFTARSKITRKIRVSIGASKHRPSSYPPNVVFFRSGEVALGLDNTASPEWGNGEFAYVMLAVKDTGIGIDDRAQMRLFERFNQATPRTEGIYGGSGLGLNVSRKLCHLHGGEIGVSSKEGEGSTFGFFFRVRKATYTGDEGVGVDNISEVDKLSHDIQVLGRELSEVEAPTQEVRIPKTPPLSQIDELRPGGPLDERTRHTHEIARQAMVHNNEGHQNHNWETSDRRILVVEDNIINRRIISRKLRSLGFEVIEANNGEEALNIFQNSKLDCILMDQEMPVMDGNAATKCIRELEKGRDTHIPILGVTANVRAAQKSEMLEVGMDDIIHKPFRTDDIVAKISQFVTATWN